MASQNVAVLSGPVAVASDWNNRITEAALKISSQIPAEVGTAAGIIVGIFWPASKMDIFQALREDVAKLVELESLDYELHQRQPEMDALKSTIERYKAAKSLEKGNLLCSWITSADRLSVFFQESMNSIHLILPIITLALLHLTGLRERLDFGKELYDEDNTKQWKEDLEVMYKTYIVDVLPDVFRRWKTWRESLVEVKAWITEYPAPIAPFFLFRSHASVEDTITGERKHFSMGMTESTSIFSALCKGHMTRMCNDAIADMAGCISTTFAFNKLLHDNEKHFPKYEEAVFGRIFRGAYSEDLLRTDGEVESAPSRRTTRPVHDDSSPNSGPISKVIIREWNSIDAMQFVYWNHEGSLAGNAAGGQKHEIDVRGKPIDGLRMGFSQGLLVYVQIIYCDGTSSSTYGNRSSWPCSAEASPKAPAGYRLSSWSYSVDTGPSGTYGPSVVRLEYTPHME